MSNADNYRIFFIKQMVVSAVHTKNNVDVSDYMSCNENSFWYHSITLQQLALFNVWVYMKNVKGHMPWVFFPYLMLHYIINILFIP